MNNLDDNENLKENDSNLNEDSILDFKTLCNLRQGRLESVLSERYRIQYFH